MHLPFNHVWQTLEAVYHHEPTDYSITTFRTTTSLRQFCDCGKVRTKQIAPFRMTPEQVNEYVKRVYNEG